MLLLLSGEGKGDIGQCISNAVPCCDEAFRPGPMAWIVDQLVERAQGYDYSHISANRAYFVSKRYLAGNNAPKRGKPTALRGKSRKKETAYFFRNAMALADCAKSLASEESDVVIAVLFRDSDGTASAGRGIWQDKYDSILEGFNLAKFPYGVAMVPNPKSEAWLLCAIKTPPYMHCEQIELESGNDKSPNSLKDQLTQALAPKDGNSQGISELIRAGGIDVTRIDMPSFKKFRERLEIVVRKLVG